MVAAVRARFGIRALVAAEALALVAAKAVAKAADFIVASQVVRAPAVAPELVSAWVVAEPAVPRARAESAEDLVL